MVGLIWAIQSVHYPLFALVGDADFVGHENEHNARMGKLPAIPSGLVLSRDGTPMSFMPLHGLTARWCDDF